MASNNQAYDADEKTPIKQKEKPVARVSFWWVLIGLILVVLIIALLIALIVMIATRNRTNDSGANPMPQVGAPGSQKSTPPAVPKTTPPAVPKTTPVPTPKVCDIAERLNGNGSLLFEKESNQVKIHAKGMASRGNVVYMTEQKILFELTNKNGEYSKSRKKSFPVMTKDIAMTKDYMYVATFGKKVYKLDKMGKKKGEINLPISPDDIAVYEDYISTIHSLPGNKYEEVMYTHKGQENSKTMCPTECMGIAYDANGNLYTSTESSGVIVKDKYGNKKTVINVENPFEITFDPSGNAIITSKAKNRIYVVGKDMKLKLTIENTPIQPKIATVTDDCHLAVAYAMFVKFYKL